MHVILVPGLWLTADSWDDVASVLRAKGHLPHALTMPGVGSTGPESSSIGIDAWVDAVVAEIDAIEGPVALIGHSGGGNVVWGATDRRAARVAHVVFVDTFPPVHGTHIWDFPVVDGVVPFPGWESFEPAEISDLDEHRRESLAATMQSIPQRVPSDPLVLTDARRHHVPVTLLMGTVSVDEVSELLEKEPEWIRELVQIEHLAIVGIESGHWPQFSQPSRIADEIVAALTDRDV